MGSYLPLTAREQKIRSPNRDRFRQLIIHVISAVLDGNSTAAPSAGNDRNRFSAVAAQGKEKGVEGFVAGTDPVDQIFFAQLGSS